MTMIEKTRRMVTAVGLLAALCLAALLLTQLPTQAQKPIGPPAPTGRAGSDEREPTDPAKDIPKLKEDIRRLKAQLDELRSQNYAILSHLTFAPETVVQHEDYSQA